MPKSRKSNPSRPPRRTPRPGKGGESSRKPIAPAAPMALAAPIEQAMQQASESAALTDEAIRDLQRQLAAETAHTIEIVGNASLVPLHLLGAWSRFWTTWAQDVAGSR